jgi:hypothetical protein
MHVVVTDPRLDEEGLDDTVSQLRLELLDYGSEGSGGSGGSVGVEADAVDGEPPPGARAVDVLAIGALVVAVTGGLKAVREVLDVIDGWRQRNRTATVRVRLGDNELELSAATEQTQAELVREFLARSE